MQQDIARQPSSARDCRVEGLDCHDSWGYFVLMQDLVDTQNIRGLNILGQQGDVTMFITQTIE